MRKYLILLLALMTTSCANYISKMYNELDGRPTRQIEQKRANADQAFDQYRNPKRISSGNTRNVSPQVKRRYNNTSVPTNSAEAPKRVTANSFHDYKNDGSLWAGSGNDNYLFTKNKWKRHGDIILVNVQTRLKNNITMELKRAFPPIPKLGGAPATAEAAPATPPPADDGEDKSADAKVHDKISSVIVEEISRDHLLVRGQKSVLYKNRKHLVELQALISRKDINEDDTVDSTKFLESSVSVLR